jgi:hypothetical protein
MAEITQNPDYQLVMKFLQNIRPGDMDQESSDQLMMIGQRMQAGGALTDREREMFEAVVGATDRFPVEQMDTFPQGTNPDIMKDPSMGAISEGEMRLAMDTPSPQMQKSYQVDDRMEQMTPMDMQQMIDAGIIVPKRPMPRPTAPMQSLRPVMRPTR